MTVDTPETQAPAAPKAKARSSRGSKPINARTMAGLVAKRIGRNVTPKQVRQFVRDNVAAYQDDAYTVHSYDGRLQRLILDGFVARTARRTASVNANKAKDSK